MSVNDGDVFKTGATANQTVLLQLQFLASAGNGSVMNPATENGGAPSRRTATADTVADIMTFLAVQQREEQIRILNDRLAELDRRSEEQLRAAQERLAEILRTANKTKDGRAVFAAEDGAIYDERGNTVAADEIAWDQWNADRPSWSAYQDAMQDKSAALAFKTRVDDLQGRMAQGLTDKELPGFGDDLTALEKDTQGFTGATLTPAASVRSTSAAKLYDTDAASTIPVGASFDRAVKPVIETSPEDPAAIKPLASFTPG
jgi:hypothetical protein